MRWVVEAGIVGLGVVVQIKGGGEERCTSGELLRVVFVLWSGGCGRLVLS